MTRSEYGPDIGQPTAHNKIRDKLKKHSREIYIEESNDFAILPSQDVSSSFMIDLEPVIVEAFNAVRRPINKLGIALDFGLFGLTPKMQASYLEEVALDLNCSTSDSAAMKDRFTKQKFVRVDFNADHISEILDNSAHTVRRERRMFLDYCMLNLTGRKRVRSEGFQLDM